MFVIGIRFNVVTYFPKKNKLNILCKCFATSKTSFNGDGGGINLVIDKAASEKFIDRDIQKLLKKLTGLDLDKVFRARALGQPQTPPEYKFMTTEQIQEAAKLAMKKAKHQLQMPPLVPIKEDVPEILQEEPKMIGFDQSKYVFTDITYGVKEKDRIIVVREPSGVLRKAFNFERHRMNQIYFPRFGRTLTHPKMFEPKYLELLWEKGEFEFILDRACIQFEPDDKLYHDVTLATYRQINEQMAFDKLRSTRHYGPLCFYLALNKNIDNLLLENLKYDKVDDAVTAIELYNTVNPDARSASLLLDPDDRLQYIRDFIKLESKIPDKLELALQSVVDIPQEKSQASA